jgi:hypothetical protein
MRLVLIVAVLLALGGLVRSEEAAPADPGAFKDPVLIQADGKDIDVEIGHADPYVIDWDGDGMLDLLVGQFGAGKLLIFRNEGTSKDPKFGKAEVFKAGDADGRIPSG